MSTEKIMQTKLCNSADNFKNNLPRYVMNEVSLQSHYTMVALLVIKNKMAFIAFCTDIFHILTYLN